MADESDSAHEEKDALLPDDHPHIQLFWKVVPVWPRRLAAARLGICGEGSQIPDSKPKRITQMTDSTNDRRTRVAVYGRVSAEGIQ